MIPIVLDASVVIKWILPDRPDEADTEHALLLLEAYKTGSIFLVEPPHWLSEVLAVVARLAPAIVGNIVKLLVAMRIPTSESIEIYTEACRLSHHLNHHLFDTLYHALALYHRDAVFVTADERYYEKAKKLGSIARLSDFRV